MQFAYTIIYVPDVPASLAFYGRAFGFITRFLHESEQYGELDTGSTVLAFASHTLGRQHWPEGMVEASASPQPLGMEVAFVCDDVEEAHQRALKAGARELAAPQQKPWGQTVSWLRCPDGSLVELCTAVSM